MSSFHIKIKVLTLAYKICTFLAPYWMTNCSQREAQASRPPNAFKVLLTDITDYFDRASHGAALETLHRFDVRTETPFSSDLRAYTASTINGSAFTISSQVSSSHAPAHNAPTAPFGSSGRCTERPSPHDAASMSSGSVLGRLCHVAL